MIVLLTIVTGLVYPLAMTGIAQVALPAPGQRQPDRRRTARCVGSELIGQTFADAALLPRPAVGAGDDGYDAARLRRGSNLGPTSQALIERVSGERRRSCAAESATAPVPVDLVTDLRHGPRSRTSRRPRRCSRCRASPRRAACRRPRCASWSSQHIEGRALGVLGEPRVNVLQLNLALDALRSRSRRLAG